MDQPSSGYYRQSRPGAPVSLERGTNRVPLDGKYYLLKHDKVVASFKSLRQGEAAFREALKEFPLETPQGMPQRDRQIEEWLAWRELDKAASYGRKKKGPYDQKR